METPLSCRAHVLENVCEAKISNAMHILNHQVTSITIFQ